MRRMLAAAALLALAAASTGGAASQRTIPVSTGDTIDVVGTKVACFVVVSSGKKGIGCFLADAKGLIPKTYGAGLAADGEVVVHQVRADGTTKRLFKRTLSSVSGHYYKVNTGDAFGFEITGGSLGCRVIDVRTGAKQYRGKKVACWLATKTAPFPKTYGIAVSNTFAGAFAFDENGVAGENVFVRFQPH